MLFDGIFGDLFDDDMILPVMMCIITEKTENQESDDTPKEKEKYYELE